MQIYGPTHLHGAQPLNAPHGVRSPQPSQGITVMTTRMRSDVELKDDVLAELKWEPSVRESEIGVIVKDGIVTLTGKVEFRASKSAAERAAQAGVELGRWDREDERSPGAQQPSDLLIHIILKRWG